MNNKETLILCGWAGIGKTYLGKKYPDEILDLESTNYKWLQAGMENLSDEEKKGLPNRTQNPNWPDNYLKALKKNMGKYKVILTTITSDVRELLEKITLHLNLLFLHKNAKLSI